MLLHPKRFLGVRGDGRVELYVPDRVVVLVVGVENRKVRGWSFFLQLWEMCGMCGREKKGENNSDVFGL